MKLSESQQQELIDLYNNGTSLKLLGKKYGKKPNTISKLLKDMGVQVRSGCFKSCQEIYPQEVRDEMVRLYESGLSYNDIARRYEIGSGQQVKNIISKEEYEDRGMRKYKYDETFFEEIDTPVKAQVLGFIAADGYCNDRTLRIELKETDRDYLEHMNKILQNESPIRRYIRNHTSPGFENASPSCALIISSIKLANRLHSLGILPNKSLSMSYPSYISEELHPYYIRGYFEGDGSVSINSKSGSFSMHMLGTKEFLQTVQTIISRQVGIDDYYITQPSKIYRLTIRTQPSMLKVMQWMYQDPVDFVMKRKYKFLELMEERQARLAGRWRRKKGAA